MQRTEGKGEHKDDLDQISEGLGKASVHAHPGARAHTHTHTHTYTFLVATLKTLSSNFRIWLPISPWGRNYSSLPEKMFRKIK